LLSERRLGTTIADVKRSCGPTPKKKQRPFNSQKQAGGKKIGHVPGKCTRANVDIGVRDDHAGDVAGRRNRFPSPLEGTHV
jgi:hypothetical protein